MNCVNCGAEIKDGLKFCASCGFEIRIGEVSKETYNQVSSTININEQSNYENTSTASESGFFDDLVNIIKDLFKDPGNLVNRAINLGKNSAISIGIMALIFAFVRPLISGAVYNIFSMSRIATSLAGQAISIVAMVIILSYMIKKHSIIKLDNIEVFSILMAPYAVRVVCRILSVIVSRMRISYAPGVISTFGIVIFILIMYKLLSQKGFMDDKNAMYTVILLAIFA